VSWPLLHMLLDACGGLTGLHTPSSMCSSSQPMEMAHGWEDQLLGNSLEGGLIRLTGPHRTPEQTMAPIRPVNCTLNCTLPPWGGGGEAKLHLDKHEWHWPTRKMWEAQSQV